MPELYLKYKKALNKLIVKDELKDVLGRSIWFNTINFDFLWIGTLSRTGLSEKSSIKEKN